MNYLFRLPKFPVLVDLGDQLICANNRAQFEKKIAQFNLGGEDARRIIDSTAEGFALYPKSQVVAPSIGVRRWTKQQIIDLYNQRRGPGTPEMVSTSLANRSLQRIVSEAVALLSRR
jgi:hypothetical protein